MTDTLDELIAKINERFDPDELVDLLELSTEEILDAFPHKVQSKRDRFDEFQEEAQEMFFDFPSDEGC